VAGIMERETAKAKACAAVRQIVAGAKALAEIEAAWPEQPSKRPARAGKQKAEATRAK